MARLSAVQESGVLPRPRLSSVTRRGGSRLLPSLPNSPTYTSSWMRLFRNARRLPSAVSVRQLEVRPLRQPCRLAYGCTLANLYRDCPDAVPEACQLSSGTVAGWKEEAPILRPTQTASTVHAKQRG